GWLSVLEPAAVAAVAGLLAAARAAREAALAPARRGVRPHPLVLPRRDVVPAPLRVPPGEEPVVLLRVGELVADDHAGVRVRVHVLVEPALVLDDVVDDAAEKRDVAARADPDVPRRRSTRPCEPRVDVDHVGAALPGLHHPLEPHRVVLGHVRAHDRDAVGVRKILLELRGAASSERGAQTGHRGAVSYTGLVLDLNDAEPGEELLDQVVLLVVERRAAEVGDAHRAPRRPPVGRLLLPGRLARLEEAIHDHLHRALERELLPLGAVGTAVLDPVFAKRPGGEALGRGPFRAEPAA